MGGFLAIRGGTVRVMNLDPSVAGSKIAYIFQSPRLVSWRNALENVLLGMELRFGRGDKKNRTQKALELLALVGLSNDVEKYPSILSGGELKRVSIARPLAVDPEFISMYGPFSAPDQTNRQKMKDNRQKI